MLHKFFTILFTLFMLQAMGQTIAINEIMAKNTLTLQDSDGDYSDWLELYNPSNETVSLDGWWISDNLQDPAKWIFPAITLPSKSYLLVFASGKDRTQLTELHTNFKLSSGGEALILSNAAGIVVDQTNPVALQADESYGRIPDGSGPATHLLHPSPGNSNNPSNVLVFSKPGGLYDSPFQLTITSYDHDTIYYTLDGSLPTSNAQLYTQPLPIDFLYNSPNVLSEIPTSPPQNLIVHHAWQSPAGCIDKATVVRSVAYHNGQAVSPVYTHTYILDTAIHTKYDLPIIALSTDQNNLFNQDTGIYHPGVHYNPNNPEYTGNYFQEGPEWERDVHIEYYDKNGLLGFSQDAGMRIHGAKSCHAAQKTLRLYARQEYGKKHFSYPLFPQKEKDEYKRFLLRGTMNPYHGPTIFKDEMAHAIVREMEIDCQDFQPVVVFLNGEYWGIHTLRDRLDERFLSEKYDIPNDSIEIFGWQGLNMQNLTQFIETHDVSYPENYESICQIIDVENFINYQIAEIFLKNYDWPGNNCKMYKSQRPGSKWRWLFFDIDMGMGDYTYNMFEHATLENGPIWPNPPQSTLLLRSLLTNESFRARFINRFREALNSSFQTDRMHTILALIKPLYRHELPRHIIRWNFPESIATWESAINFNIIDFIENRPCEIKNQIMAFFELEEFDCDCNCDSSIHELPPSLLTIAPNPNKGKITLINNTFESLNGVIQIHDIMGRMRFQQKQIQIFDQQNLDVSHLPNGIYILSIHDKYHYIKQKFIINH